MHCLARTICVVSVVSILASLAAPPGAFAATSTWSGGALNNDWTSNLNWSGVGGAGAGDALVFPGGASRRSNNNDFPINTSFASITFDGTSTCTTGNNCNYVLGGTQIALAGPLACNVPAGTLPIVNLNVLLTADSTFSTSTGTNTSPLTFGGVVGLNTHTVSISGPGIVQFDGSFSGTGTLIKSGTGRLNINGTATSFATTQLQAGSLYASGTQNAVVISGTGTLRGNGSVGTVTVSGINAKTIAPGTGLGTTGAGTITAGAVTLSSTTTLVINEIGLAPAQQSSLATTSINLGSATLVLVPDFVPAAGTQFTIVTGAVTGTFSNGSSITVNGRPFDITYNANSVVVSPPMRTLTWTGGGGDDNWSTAANWSGGVAPAAGDALVFPDAASRKTNTNDFASNTRFQSIAVDGSDYQLNGNPVDLIASLTATAPLTGTADPRLFLGLRLVGASTFGNAGARPVGVGAVDLNGQSLSVSGSGNWRFLGTVSGSGNVFKFSSGTMSLEDNNNSYTGSTSVAAGVLTLRGTGAAGSGSGAANGTSVSSGATLKLSNDSLQGEPLTLNGTGVGGTAGALTTDSTCTAGCGFSGAGIVLASNTLVVVPAGDTLTAGPFTDAGLLRTLTVAGSGTLVMPHATSSVHGGGTTVTGNLRVNGTTGTILLSGGTLQGVGTVGSVSGPGTIAPGTPATAILKSNGNVTLTAANTLNIKLGGANAGTDYDQLSVDGTTAIGGANLSLSMVNGAPLFVNDEFTIVKSSGGVSGQFAQGTTISAGGAQFSITYNGTSVVLKVTAVPLTWVGGGSDNNWTTPINWNPASVPAAGANLIFPANPPRLASVNDLPAGTTIGSLTITGNGYAISGSPINLSGGIVANLPAAGSGNDLQLPITLTQAQTFNVNTHFMQMTGPLNLNGSALTIDGTGDLTLGGVVSGGGGIVKNGTSAATLAGSNTYTGVTSVNAGTLRVSATNGLGATGAGNHTVVASNAALMLLNNVTAVPEAVTISGTGSSLFGALSANSCPLGCSMSGAVTLASDSALSALNASDRLLISGSVGASGPFALTTKGAGTIVLGAANTYTGGTTITGGTLRIDVSTGAVNVSAAGVNGATLAGAGSVGLVGGTGGTVAPGASAGTLSAGSTDLANKTLAIELGGLAAGTQHDVLSVTGTVALAGAQLSASLINGFVPVVGNQFSILQSTGAISGQFAQGASLTQGGVTYGITYNANSVVLTVTAANVPFTLTVAKTGSGTGSVSTADAGIVCGNACSSSYPGGSNVSVIANAANGSTFMGWSGACTGTGNCLVTMNAAKTVTGTFASNSVVTNNRVLDVDDNGTYDALTDGLMIIRYLFGLTGTSLTGNATAPGAPRTDPAAIATYLNDIKPKLDLDGNGQSDALTDGLVAIRYLFGLRGSTLTQGAVGNGATRPDAATIEPYIQTLMP